MAEQDKALVFADLSLRCLENLLEQMAIKALRIWCFSGMVKLSRKKSPPKLFIQLVSVQGITRGEGGINLG